MDTNAGTFTVGPLITPPGNWVSMAIDSTGGVLLARGTYQTYFVLDPATGQTAYVGATAVPNSICMEMAYDSNNQLWAIFEDFQNGLNSGIYRIDTTTWITTRVVVTPVAYSGLAFGWSTAASNYCLSKTTSLSCLPSLSADGIASPTAKSGFIIRASSLNNNRPGLLLYTTNGRYSLPFQGGLLCVRTPVQRSPPGSTAGTPLPALDCSGTWSIDYNAMIWDKYHATTASADLLNSSPFLLPGTTVQCQWWGRDPGFAAPNNAMLSDGLEFTLSP